MQSVQEFPYSKTAFSKRARVLVTVLLFLAAAAFLWWGPGSSLFEPRHGGGLSDQQNLAVNLLSALACLIFGFLNFLWLWKKEPADPSSVLILEDRIIAPKQGVSGRPVDIRFSDISQMKKLSVDGVWEFNVHSADKFIRVPKASLNVPDDFERMVSCVQRLATGCELLTEERIDPPQMNS